MNSVTHVERYSALRPRYEQLTHKIDLLIRDLFRRNSIRASIESRTKEIDSFAQKISRGGKAYGDPLFGVTDFAGVRVILTSLRDVAVAKELIAAEFTVDSARSVQKGERLEVDRFGYLSEHR